MESIQDRSRWARNYIKERHPAYTDAETRFREVILSLLGPDSLVFDAGCGHGGPVQDHIKDCRLVVGADLDIDALKINPNLAGRSVIACLDHVPFKNASFNLITSQWVLEHISDPTAMFREFDRIMKSGGYFVTITPNIANWMIRLSGIIPTKLKARLMTLLGRGEQDTYPTYYRANSIKDLRRLTELTGWELTTIESFGAPFYFIFSRNLFRLAVFFDKCYANSSRKTHLLAVWQKQ